MPTLSTGRTQELSPMVDSRLRRSTQMWTRPGEIDVDKYAQSFPRPRSVDECGWPVEGSGEDEAVTSRRCPQTRGRVRWTSAPRSATVDADSRLYPGCPHVKHRWISR